MKKIMFFAAVAAVFSLASCKKEALNEGVVTESPVFTATISEGTRTTVSATDGKVAWESTDKITIADASEGSATYKITSIDEEGKATFEIESGTLGQGPYTATYGTAPATAQTYAATPGNLYMTAETSTNSLTFTVQCGLMKFNLTKANESVKSIAVTGTPTDGSETTYTLTCTDAQSIAEKKSFYIALPAGNYDKIVITNTEGKVCFLTAASGINLENNHIKPVTFDAGKLNFGAIEDLSEEESANCYIVYKAGKYKFNATVRGNGKTTDGADADKIDITDAKAQVLWESFGTAETPASGSLVNSAVLNGNDILFTTTSNKGNAVIAVKDASGKILWSWHIWLAGEQPQEQVYNNNAGTMMDRNLGATSAEKGNPGALGLLYQWGRKDPFLGSSAIDSDSDNSKTAASFTATGVEWSNVSGPKTPEESVAIPTTFITSGTDWTTQNDNLWKSTASDSPKTMYDPCPPGWRVPEGGAGGVWSKAGFAGGSTSFDATNKGISFSTLQDGGVTWYPGAGYRNSSDVSLRAVGNGGSYWACSVNGRYAHRLLIDRSEGVFPSDYVDRADGRIVRCLRLEGPKQKFAITVDNAIEHGSISTDPSGSVEWGTEVIVTATPSDGYELATLTCNGTDIKTAGSFTMPQEDVTVSGSFQLKDFAITGTVTPESSGTVKFKKSGSDTEITEAYYGDEITATAIPATGYELESIKWNTDGGSATDITTDKKFTMPAKAVTVTVTFKKTDYSITKGIATNGSFTVKKGDDEVEKANYQDEITIAATPDAGYILDVITVKTDDGSESVAVTDGKFTMPAKAVTVTVTFKSAGPEYVVMKMGTSGTSTLKWAKYNLGATTVNDYGGLYSWGNLTGQSGNSGFNPAFTSDNYNATEGSKIASKSDWSKEKHDAAYNELGGNWRMPTKNDFYNLDRACGGSGQSGQKPAAFSKTSHIENGKVKKGKYWLAANQTELSDIAELKDIKVAGLLYSDGENYLFFPAAGFSGNYGQTNIRGNGGSAGYYWSSDLYTSNTNNAYDLFFMINSSVNPNNQGTRCFGFSVRPVSD